MKRQEAKNLNTNNTATLISNFAVSKAHQRDLNNKKERKLKRIVTGSNSNNNTKLQSGSRPKEINITTGGVTGSDISSMRCYKSKSPNAKIINIFDKEVSVGNIQHTQNSNREKSVNSKQIPLQSSKAHNNLISPTNKAILTNPNLFDRDISISNTHNPNNNTKVAHNAVMNIIKQKRSTSKTKNDKNPNRRSFNQISTNKQTKNLDCPINQFLTLDSTINKERESSSNYNLNKSIDYANKHF